VNKLAFQLLQKREEVDRINKEIGELIAEIRKNNTASFIARGEAFDIFVEITNSNVKLQRVEVAPQPAMIAPARNPEF
jgi:hypothetical protein